MHVSEYTSAPATDTSGAQPRHLYPSIYMVVWGHFYTDESDTENDKNEQAAGYARLRLHIWCGPTTHLQQILGACTQQTRTGAPATDTSGVCIRQTSAPATDTYASGVYNYRQSAPTTKLILVSRQHMLVGSAANTRRLQQTCTGEPATDTSAWACMRLRDEPATDTIERATDYIEYTSAPHICTICMSVHK